MKPSTDPVEVWLLLTLLKNFKEYKGTAVPYSPAAFAAAWASQHSLWVITWVCAAVAEVLLDAYLVGLLVFEY